MHNRYDYCMHDVCLSGRMSTFSVRNQVCFRWFSNIVLSCFHCNGYGFLWDNCKDVLCGKVLNSFPIHTDLYYLSIEFCYEVLNDPSL